MYPLIATLSITFFVTGGNLDEPESWRPFDHPSISVRTFSAYSRPARVVALAAESPCRVDKVLFAEGDRVPGKPGEMVSAVLLDAAVEKEMHTSAEIALEISKNAESRASLSIVRTETAAQLASKDLERMRELHVRGDASESDLDRALLADENARVALELARVSLLDARAAVRAATSEVAIIAAQIDRLTLRAPAGWRVEQRLVEPGAGVSPGAPLMVLADLSSFEIEIPMAEEEIQVLGLQPVKIERVSNRSRVSGMVDFVGAVPDPLTRRRRVIIRIPAEEFTLEPLETGGGIELQISIDVPDISGGVRVPHRFLGRRLEQWIVKTSDGKVHVVTPIRSDDDGWVVLPGDLPSSAVIIKP